MSKLIIYAAEQSVATEIKKNLNLGYYTKVLQASQDKMPDNDLYGFASILASSVFNNNSHYFSQQELKAAKNSPINKPVNNYHIPNEILGHIVKSYFLSPDYELIADDFTIGEHKVVHLANDAYLYRYNDSVIKGLSSKLNDIIQTIEAGDMYVSMECKIADFDYALRASDGSVSMLKRTEMNAELTKLIPMFGGKGIYEDKEIGMYLRGINFCGKGMVKNPANPNSIILGYGLNFEDSRKTASYDKNIAENVYNKEEVKKTMDDNKTTAELETLQKELAAAKESLTKVNSEKDALTQQLAEKETALTEATTKLADFEVKSKELSDKNTELTAEVKKLNRYNVLASKGITGKDAEDTYTEFGELADAMFEKMVELKVKTQTAQNDVKNNDTPDLDKVKVDDTLMSSLQGGPAKDVLARVFANPISKEKN